MIKSLLFAASFTAISSNAMALDLEVGVSALQFGLGTSDGTDFAQGNILKIGYFAVDPNSSNFSQLSDALIIANKYDYGFLSSHFVQFGTNFLSGEILGSNDPDYASSQFYTNLTGAPTNFTGRNIFLWAFNSTVPVSGSFSQGAEIGIFKSPGVFPSGADELSNVAGVSLEPGEFGASGSPSILVGGFGVGTVDPSGASPGGSFLYNTEAVAPNATAITEAATSVGTTNAFVNATVNAKGVAGGATVTFLYGLTNLPTTESTSTPVAGSTNTAVSTELTGLAGGTEYFFRVKVVTSLGTTLGNVLSFTTAPAALTVEALATKLGPVPDAGSPGSGVPTGATWNGFGSPAINDAGQVAYIGKWKAPAPAKPNSGIFLNDTLLVQVGDPVPGIPDTVFKSFRDPVIDQDGRVAFLAAIKGATGAPVVPSTADSVVVTNGRNGQLEIIAREGSAAPGAGGATFKAFTAVSIAAGSGIAEAAPGIPSDSGVLFTASLLTGTGTPVVASANDTGAWWLASGHTDVELVVREGADGFAPGEIIKSFLVLKGLGGSAGHGRGLFTGNEAHLQLVLDPITGPNTYATALATPGSLAIVAASNDELGGSALPLARWAKLNLPSTGGFGANISVLGDLQKSFGGITSLNAKGIFSSADSGATWEPVAQSSDPAPGFGSGELLSGFKDPVNSYTDAGVAFIGTAKGGTVLSSNDTGLFWQPEGGPLSLVAREGSLPPNGPAGSQLKAFSSVTLPGGSVGPIFTAQLVKGIGTAPGPGGITSANDFGLYGVDSSGSALELVRESLPLLGKTVKSFVVIKAVSGTAGAGRSTNSNSGVVLLVKFTDATESIVKITLP